MTEVAAPSIDLAAEFAYDSAALSEGTKAVKAFLAGQFGVDPSRLDALGLGETDLLFPDAPEDGRNRRVEVSTVA